MNRKWMQFICFLLIFALVCPFFPRVKAAGDGFYLAVFTEYETVVEPERIPVLPGQTVRQALMASVHSFEGLEQGYIQAVDGVSESFYLAYDNGGWDLDQPAADLTGLVLNTRELPWEPSCQSLLVYLGEFRETTTGVQNYPAAREAYGRALEALRTGEAREEAMAALEAAAAEFDAMMDGPKAQVQFVLAEGDESAARIKLTGPYGDVHTAEGTSIQVIPGTYDYEVSDRDLSLTRGTLEVSDQGCTQQIRLPQGSWFSEVKLLTASDKTNGFEREILGPNSARFYIPDTAGSSSVFLNAVRGDVPDTSTTRVWTDYVGVNGTDYSTVSRSWNTTSAVLSSLLSQGMEGRTFCLEARYPAPEGYQMIQYYSVQILRVPTLSGLAVESEGARLPLDFQPDTLTYHLKAASDTVSVIPAAFGSEGYSITINGSAVVSGQAASMATGTVNVTVSHEKGTSRTYEISVDRVNPVTITVHHSADVELELQNRAGSRIPAQSETGTASTFQLIPGENYTYITTKNTWYHTTGTFTAGPQVTVTAADPRCQDWISTLQTAQKNTAGSPDTCPYPISPSFSPDTHSYYVEVGDVNTTFAVFASMADTSVKLTAEYSRLSNGAKENRTVSTGRPMGTLLPGLAETTGDSNRAVLRASKTENSVTYYQDYELTLRRKIHLYDGAFFAEGSTLILRPAFDRDITDYEMDVPQGADSLTALLCGLSFGSSAGYTADLTLGAYAETAALSADRSEQVLPLDTDAQEETLTVQVRHGDPLSIPTTYSFQIHKLPPVTARFAVSPETAVVGMVNDTTGKRLWAGKDGDFVLLRGHNYTATVTCPGYLPQTVSFLADQDRTLGVTLEPAPRNDALPMDMEASWPDFRGNPANNAVVDAALPTRSEDAVLYWANQLGEGYSSGAVGCPILADGCIYTYAGTNIFKVDPVDGKVLVKGTMAGNSSFAINAPTYAEGMIFVGLANGRVQAFNAETLESLWLYSDPLKGQPNCCITYNEGFIYAGFWNGETADANFVCLTVTDEDPTSDMEAKSAVWTYTTKGGYYWSGACIREDHLLIGTDDGESGYLTGHGSILSLNPKTGRLLNSVCMPGLGDVRCAISYDEATDAYYFTSKGGDFYRIRVAADGTFVPDSLQSIHLSNGSNNPSAPPMSTSTPVIYNGRAYIGVSGTAQFGAYSGHNITVIDLASWRIAYSVQTQGYCQTSGLLTTAYEADDDRVYVYFFDNYTPGKLRMLEDRPGQTSPSLLTRETYRSGSKDVTLDTAYVLFTPYGPHAQYAICSPICDDTGTMYFKNDSGFLMALGPTIQELRVTENPRLAYALGETFDPEGMRVEAVYTNGAVRDVTDYVSFSREPLTADDTEFMIRFEHTLYQNVEEEPGVDYLAPMAILELSLATQDDREVAAEVEQLIAAIPDPVTEDSAEAIAAARAAYDALTDAQKALVSNYDLLLAAEEALEALRHVHEYSDYVYAGDWTHVRTCSCGQEETEACTPRVEPGWEPTCREDGHTDRILCEICGGELDPGQVLPAFDCPSAGMTDVNKNAWYHRAVDDMLRRGIMSGTGSGRFQPEKTLSRAELVQVFYNMAGATWESGQTAFTDVPAGAWFARAVAWASENGIVNGTGKTTFGPQNSATREMVVTILYRYAQGEAPETDALGTFSDRNLVSGWARNAVNWAVASGILNGSGGKLNPGKNITRAELAQLIMNYLKNN